MHSSRVCGQLRHNVTYGGGAHAYPPHSVCASVGATTNVPTPFNTTGTRVRLSSFLLPPCLQ